MTSIVLPFIVISLLNMKACVNNTPLNLRHIEYRHDGIHTLKSGIQCLVENKWSYCPVVPALAKDLMTKVPEKSLQHMYEIDDRGASVLPETSKKPSQPLHGRVLIDRLTSNLPMPKYDFQMPLEPLNLLPAHGDIPQTAHQYRFLPTKYTNGKKKLFISIKKSDNSDSIKMATKSHALLSVLSANESRRGMKHFPSVFASEKSEEPATNTVKSEEPTSSTVRMETTSRVPKNQSLFNTFIQTLDMFERKFYTATFTKLTSISPPERRENGISFVQSGLFLHLLLTGLSLEVEPETSAEIDASIGLTLSDMDKIQMMQQVICVLPASSDDLKFRWSSRLVLGARAGLRPRSQAADVLRLHVDHLNGTETPDVLAKILNRMVEVDSGGAMHNTFEEEELAEGARAVLLSTVYIRARWRSAPTLLNGTRSFGDAAGSPPRAARMFRINDVMRYADLNEWDAEAVEISYAKEGLSLLVLVPRGRSLRALAARAAAASLDSVFARMRTMRVAATLPLYTLRMTLLLPTKLQAMGISRLVDTANATSDALRLSHAVQRLMFWAEAGRNAFKDDGIEWDETPELELVVDRPYLFFVRWHNITLMNGNFVL